MHDGQQVFSGRQQNLGGLEVALGGCARRHSLTRGWGGVGCAAGLGSVLPAGGARRRALWSSLQQMGTLYARAVCPGAEGVCAGRCPLLLTVSEPMATNPV